VKLGLLVETEDGLDWDHWRATCAAADELGFESVWISDHLQSPWAAGRHGLDPWIALAVAAAETRRITLGVLVSPIMFREPAIVARMAEAIAELNQGRFVIGLGLGWNAAEHAAAGIAFPPVQERSQRLADGIECIRRELAGHRIPILVGGKGINSTLPIAARLADEWNVTTSSPTEYTKASGELDRLCREIGRDPDDIRRSVACGFLIGRDADELHRRAQRMRRLIPALTNADTAGEMGWIVGTPAQMIDALIQLQRAGAQRAVLGHYDTDDTAALEIIAEQVMANVA